MQRARQGRRMHDEAERDQATESDEQDEVEEEEDLPNRLQAMERERLLPKQGGECTSRHGTLEPGPREVGEPFPDGDILGVVAVRLAMLINGGRHQGAFGIVQLGRSVLHHEIRWGLTNR